VIVAIDGPAGSGKSTVARRLAEVLGYTYVDTGAIYRCLGLAARRAGLRPEQEAEVAALADRIAIGFDGPATAQRVSLDGEDVSEAIRTSEVSMLASAVSARPAVRAALLDLQRRLGGEGVSVLEGRDIGTVVFPEAQAKFFVTASAEVRAERRYRELVARGESVTLEQVRRKQDERDRADSERAVAPLKPAEDAELVDTSGMTIDAVVARLERRVKEIAAS